MESASVVSVFLYGYGKQALEHYCAECASRLAAQEGRPEECVYCGQRAVVWGTRMPWQPRPPDGCTHAVCARCHQLEVLQVAVSDGARLLSDEAAQWEFQAAIRERLAE